MNVLFRVDASHQMGIGHTVRCLTLATALRHKGIASQFISKAHPGNSFGLIQEAGFRLHPLPLEEPAPISHFASSDSTYTRWLGSSVAADLEQTLDIVKQASPIDWLVVDHYSLDAKWEQAASKYVKKIFVIDDLANRAHCCDILLDQTFNRDPSAYSKLVSPKTNVLCGTHFALLRPEFAALRSQSVNARHTRTPSSLLISMGGTDPDNVTSHILKTLASTSDFVNLKALVVMGPTAPHLSEVRRIAEHMPFETEVLHNVSNMPELMSQSDIAIGGAGTTAWERCCLGLPTIMIVLAANQTSIAQALSEWGAAFTIDSPSLVQQRLPTLVSLLLTDTSTRRAMSEAAVHITDGQGAARVIQKMELINGVD